MRIHIPCTALGLILTAAAAPAVQAQAVITRETVAQPVETVRSVTTVRRAHPAVRRRRYVVTRRTTVSDRVIPATRTVVTHVAAPVYDVVTPAPVVAAAPYYGQPLYDTVVAPPPVVNRAAVAVPAVAPPVAVGSAVPFYRYVYQPDRILVIDPTTNIAVEALPR